MTCTNLRALWGPPYSQCYLPYIHLLFRSQNTSGILVLYLAGWAGWRDSENREKPHAGEQQSITTKIQYVSNIYSWLSKSLLLWASLYQTFITVECAVQFQKTNVPTPPPQKVNRNSRGEGSGKHKTFRHANKTILSKVGRGLWMFSRTTKYYSELLLAMQTLYLESLISKSKVNKSSASWRSESSEPFALPPAQYSTRKCPIYYGQK